jgi:multidrug efflux system outer membrane protein
MFKRASLLCLTLTLAGCDLSPDYTLPQLTLPASFLRDTSPETATVAPATDGKWKRLDATAKIEEFAWWRMFEDVDLDRLMEQAMKDNPTLETALARVEAARALADNREADRYPSIEVGISPERTKQAPASQEPNLPPGASPNTKPYTLYNARGIISYELDLFGRNRNRARAAWSDAEAQAQDYRTARLSLQAELAQTYFRLSALRREELLSQESLDAQRRSLALVRAKHEAGAVDVLALSAAQNELAAAESELATLRDQRMRNEHALANLVGITSPDQPLSVAATLPLPPVVPAGMPSSLLERRPDIQRAAETMAAANARIGVARTGYFPVISLSAIGGFNSDEMSDLFRWSNRSWSIGPLAGTMLTQPIFEGGRLAAAKAEADANFNAAVGEYRSAVLTAFREVEDQLSQREAASTRMKAAEAALAAMRRADKAAQARFKVGYSSQIEALEARRQRLEAERAQVQVRGDQYITTVQLVRALGGSWQRPSMPESTAVPIVTPAEPRALTTLPVEPPAAPEPAALAAPASSPEAEEILPPAELPTMPDWWPRF